MKHTQDYLDVIRTAAADCRALGNTFAANELLGAAAQVAALKAQRDELLEALLELVAAVEDNERDSLRELFAAHVFIQKHKGAAHG